MVSHVLKNFLEVVPLCPDFYIEGWEESLTRWKGENFVEIQNERISNYRCHFARFFTLIGEGIKQRAGKGAVSRNRNKNFRNRCQFTPISPYRGGGDNAKEKKG